MSSLYFFSSDSSDPAARVIGAGIGMISVAIGGIFLFYDMLTSAMWLTTSSLTEIDSGRIAILGNQVSREGLLFGIGTIAVTMLLSYLIAKEMKDLAAAFNAGQGVELKRVLGRFNLFDMSEGFTRAKFLVIIWLICNGIDTFLDVLYRAGGSFENTDGLTLLVAVVYSIFLYNILSELAFTAGFRVVLDCWQAEKAYQKQALRQQKAAKRRKDASQAGAKGGKKKRRKGQQRPVKVQS